MTNKKPPVDWEAVGLDYRAGLKTLRQIGQEHGCSHVAIQKRADKEGWTRDLSARIREAAEAKVTKAEVTKEVTNEQKIAEKLVIEANAQMIADTVLIQREDLKRSRSLVQKLFEELEKLTDGLPDLKEFAAALAKKTPEDGGDEGALDDVLRKIAGLPSRADVLKKLIESQVRVIDQERKVLKLDDQPADPVESAARGAAEGAANAVASLGMDFSDVKGMFER